jgi:hypothetical protein
MFVMGADNERLATEGSRDVSRWLRSELMLLIIGIGIDDELCSIPWGEQPAAFVTIL